MSEAQVQNPDLQIIGQRESFSAKLSPHVGQIISEDGGYSQALADLTDVQKEVFYGVVLERAAFYQFGRLSIEAIELKKTPWGTEAVDPVKKRWDAKLRRAGVKDKEDREAYIRMAESISEAVTVAYFMDPDIDK